MFSRHPLEKQKTKRSCFFVFCFLCFFFFFEVGSLAEGKAYKICHSFTLNVQQRAIESQNECICIVINTVTNSAQAHTNHTCITCYYQLGNIVNNGNLTQEKVMLTGYAILQRRGKWKLFVTENLKIHKAWEEKWSFLYRIDQKCLLNYFIIICTHDFLKVGYYWKIHWY